MIRRALWVGCVVVIAGCADAPQPAVPDNTAINERDRNDAVKTPIDQNENQPDVDRTASIRKEVVARSNFSTNAHNVKIITQNGKVTLRGPVDSEEERNEIGRIASDVAGKDNVDNQLEVTTK
ncbi:BON domain-containing protein [bacterium]|nr:BON domain-containing protein [bacterium]